jgi:hypothetical protein
MRIVDLNLDSNFILFLDGDVDVDFELNLDMNMNRFKSGIWM